MFRPKTYKNFIIFTLFSVDTELKLTMFIESPEFYHEMSNKFHDQSSGNIISQYEIFMFHH